MANGTMTTAEAERLREILAQHDQKNGGRKDKEFDLASPPRVISSGGTQQNEQYRHQEYPMHMTKPRDGKPNIVKTVMSADEAEELKEKGYLDPAEYRAHVATLPPPVDPDDEEAEDLDEDEVRAQIEEASGEFDPNVEAPKPKSKGGRPRKNG